MQRLLLMLLLPRRVARSHNCVARQSSTRGRRLWCRRGRAARQVHHSLRDGGFFLLATLGAAIAEPKRVLMLHSFGRDFKPWSEYARTIRAELDRQSPWPLEIAEHSLMTARSGDENPEAPFVEYLRALHAKRPVDLIVSLGAPAVAFVQRYRQQLFASTPMVFTAVEQRRVHYFVILPRMTLLSRSHTASLPSSRISCEYCRIRRPWQW